MGLGRILNLSLTILFSIKLIYALKTSRMVPNGSTATAYIDTIQ